MDTATEHGRYRPRGQRNSSSSAASVDPSKPRRKDRSGHRTSHDKREHHDRRRNDEQLEQRRSRHGEPRHERSEHARDKDSSRKHHNRQRSRSRSRSPIRRSSRSPTAKRRRKSYSESTSPPPRSRVALPSQDESFRGEVTRGPQSDSQQPAKQKPNYKPTGLLAREANTVQGTTTVLKYHEPPEAKKPPSKEQWRMYVFKEKDLLDTIHLYARSAWLMGRDEKVTDLRLEHPSISKQHAVIQFRRITTTDQYGETSSKVKPYLIDLDSANGTRLNGKKVETSKFVQLLDQDVVKFGDSEREYVMMLPTDRK